MSGIIVSAIRWNGNVTSSVRVDEGPPRGVCEYVATVPATDAQGNALSPAQIKAALIAAWSVRRAQSQANPVDVSILINGPANV